MKDSSGSAIYATGGWRTHKGFREQRGVCRWEVDHTSIETAEELSRGACLAHVTAIVVERVVQHSATNSCRNIVNARSVDGGAGLSHGVVVFPSGNCGSLHHMWMV